ncbi:MAG: hypothetical protein QW757_00405 [Candidatus Woesearchaeota archaeon]
MSVEKLIWQLCNFEAYRTQFISELEKKIYSNKKKEDIDTLRRKVKQQLEHKYSIDSLTESRVNQQDIDNFLLNFSYEELENTLLGLQYDLPTEVILHLSRQEMMSLFIGLGKAAKNNYLKFLKTHINKGESVLELISRIISDNLSNPNLLKRDYYIRRQKNIIYDENFNPPIVRFHFNGSFFEYCKQRKNSIVVHGNDPSSHEKIKEKIKKKGFAHVFFEVKIGSFSLDVVCFTKNQEVIVYEIKGGYNHYQEGVSQLQNYGAIIYQEFHITPNLVLIHNTRYSGFIEEIVPLRLNPKTLI